MPGLARFKSQKLSGVSFKCCLARGRRAAEVLRRSPAISARTGTQPHRPHRRTGQTAIGGDQGGDQAAERTRATAAGGSRRRSAAGDRGGAPQASRQRRPRARQHLSSHLKALRFETREAGHIVRPRCL